MDYLVNDWLYRWLEAYAKINIKLRTYSRYKDIIDLHIAPYWKDKYIGEITVDAAQGYIVYKLERGNLVTGARLSGSSVNTIIAVFGQAMKVAKELGNIEFNPFVKVKRPSREDPAVKAFPLRSQRKIESYIKNAGDPKLIGVFICLYTGIRIGELLALEWSDIDFHQGVLHITKTVFRIKDDKGGYTLYTDKPKTKASKRDIPIPDMIIYMLKAHKRRSNSAFIIYNKNGDQMPVRSYQYIFEQLQKKIEIEVLSFHSLRHTFATRALECGMDYKTLGEIMGHQDPAFTIKRYGHSMFAYKKKMMNKIGKIFE